jgi:peptidase E
MTTYILHGGFEKLECESNDAFYRRVVELVPDGGTVLLVFFASQDEEHEKRFKEYEERLMSRMGGKRLTLVLATKEHFMEQVKDADAVIMRGGSTDRLMSVLATYSNLKEAFEGKLVTGSSAGAYALSAFNYDKSSKVVRTGLGIVPVKTICHYQSGTVEDPGVEAEPIMRQAYPDIPLLILKDAEWKEFSL